ncbi:MAG: type II toxin-antitoxin system RelE/ParE family toxin [Elainellaceae cyanobacterium]
MTYRIEFAKKAAKAFKTLPVQEQRRMRPKIDALAETPRPTGAVKLSGEESLYRIRVGNYRIIYAVEDKELLILVVTLGHRGGVYRNL